ncbi:hypothetical protein DPMN_188731 [Dreissena polymorpha]|uniref:Uncharacterized protein n=1 Tax=Dreissena polymorpha TaxID=45954 RepID=A0A9D4DTZ5_DREPO|nr:hypothetical protein DPMN_188731 [Dreissena polymorpha]
MMQSAMLNNSMLAMKGLSNYHHSTPVKNDKNANIIKAETPERKYEVSSPTHSTNGFFTSNMDYFSKNLISSSPFLAGYNGFPGSVPFVPNLLEQKPGPGRRKRVKENSSSQGQVIERTSIPKIEDIPALKNLTDSSSPEDIVETLKALFPVQPPKADAVHTYGTEENPVRFFVKDNEQIQTIVDSLLVICEIKVGISGPLLTKR